MLTRLSAALVALSMLLAIPATAATLSMRPATAIYSGTVEYLFDFDAGFGGASGQTGDGIYDLDITGFFNPNTLGENPVDVLIALIPVSLADTDLLDAAGLVDVEVGTDFVALLFDDLAGALAGQFTGGQLLALFSDPDLDGTASFELRRLDDLGIIPLPATGLLLLGGLAVLGCVRRRSRG